MLWNFLSPLWEKLISAVYDKFYPSIKNNYDLAPQKHQTAVKIGGLIIIILFIAFTYFYCTRNTVSIVKLTIETPKASTANMNITIKNDTSDSDRLIEEVLIHVKDYCQLSASPNKADERNEPNHEKEQIHTDEQMWIVQLDDEDVPLARLDSSYTYTLTLNRGQIDKKTSIDMSQLVPAGGFDNFSIHFSCEEDKPVVVRLECEFLFDNGESIRSDDCVFVLGYLSPDSQATQRPLSDYESERIFEDYNSLKKIETYKCNYVSDSFLDILDDYRQVVGEMED